MTEAVTETISDAQTKPDTGADLAAEVEKWKGLARKHEEQSKGNAAAQKELEKLRAAQLSDTERAVAEAKAAGRSEALLESGKRIASAELRAAAATAGLDVAGVLDLVDVSKLVTEEGEPDSKAITGAVEKFTALRGEQKPPPSSLDLGPRPTSGPPDTSARGLLVAGLTEGLNTQ